VPRYAGQGVAFRRDRAREAHEFEIGVRISQCRCESRDEIGDKTQFDAIAIGVGVIEKRSAIHVRNRCYFVLDTHVVVGDVVAQSLQHDALESQLIASCALRGDIGESAERAGLGWIREFGEGRCLEGRGIVGVDIERLHRSPHGADHPVDLVELERGALIAVGEEAIVDRKFDVVIAQAGLEIDLLVERELLLHIDADGIGLFVLLETERTLLTVQVVEAPAVVGHMVDIDTQGDAVGETAESTRIAVLTATAVEETFERRGSASGERQTGVEVAPVVIIAQAEAVHAEDLVPGPRDALIVDLFTRIELDVLRTRTAAVGGDHRRVQTTRVELGRCIRSAHDQLADRSVAEGIAELAIQRAVFDIRVAPEAVVIEIGTVDEIIEAAVLAAGLELVATEIIAATRNADFGERYGRTVLGENVDHAAGRRAV